MKYARPTEETEGREVWIQAVNSRRLLIKLLDEGNPNAKPGCLTRKKEGMYRTEVFVESIHAAPAPDVRNTDCVIFRMKPSSAGSGSVPPVCTVNIIAESKFSKHLHAVSASLSVL